MVESALDANSAPRHSLQPQYKPDTCKTEAWRNSAHRPLRGSVTIEAMSFSVLRACPSCGKANRIPPRYLASTGKCGSCKAPLSAGSEPIEVDESAFDQIVGESPVPVLVDFWAEWCGPCKAAAPELHTLAREMAGKMLILKVNIDENSNLAGRYGIQSIPNFIVFRNGKVANQRAGFAGSADMRRWLSPI